MRGEHEFLYRHGVEPRGSSPHARGAQAGASAVGKAAGIIPACVGSTLDAFGIESGDGDHPRMRGEHFKIRSMRSQ